MYKIIILLLIIASGIQAQLKPDPKAIDAKTFELYSAGKWDELITVSENAIDAGVDFYFLRLRAGVAYYKEQNYLSAIGHFEKALLFSPADLVAMEYLYYSYLFSGRESDELALIEDMPLKLKKKLQVYSKFIYGVYAEGGYTLNGDYKKQKQKEFLAPSNIYNEQKIVNDISYLSLNLRHQLGKNVKVFHGYNTITLSGLKQIVDDRGPKSFVTKTLQDEYYFNINFRLGGGYDLSSAVHYLRVKNEDVIVQYDTTVTSPFPSFIDVRENQNDFIVFLSLTKYAGHFKLGLLNSVSNMNRATQVQNTAQVVFYPLGNLNLYTVTNATLFSNMPWGSKFTNSGILDQKAGWKFFDFLWMEAGYTFGYIYNFNESDAYIAFNNVDRISNRVSVNFISPVSRHIELSLRYQYYNQETGTQYYTTPSKHNTIFTNNINHKIIGGLKWTF